MPPIVQSEVIIRRAHLSHEEWGLLVRSRGLTVLMGIWGWHTHAGSAKEAPQSGSVYGRLGGSGFSGVVDMKGSWPLKELCDRCCKA